MNAMAGYWHASVIAHSLALPLLSSPCSEASKSLAFSAGSETSPRAMSPRIRYVRGTNRYSP